MHRRTGPDRTVTHFYGRKLGEMQYRISTVSSALLFNGICWYQLPGTVLVPEGYRTRYGTGRLHTQKIFITQHVNVYGLKEGGECLPNKYHIRLVPRIIFTCCLVITFFFFSSTSHRWHFWYASCQQQHCFVLLHLSLLNRITMMYSCCIIQKIAKGLFKYN